jgi:hypothetical protein
VIYIQLAHSNDTDCDLLKFKTLKEVVEVIELNGVCEYIITDSPLGPFEEDDYTLISPTCSDAQARFTFN